MKNLILILLKPWLSMVLTLLFSLSALAADTISEAIMSAEKQRELAKYLVSKDESGLQAFFEKNLTKLKIGSRNLPGIALGQKAAIVIDGKYIEFLECLDETCGFNRQFQNQFAFDSSKSCFKGSVKILSPALQGFEVYKDAPNYFCSFNESDKSFIRMKKDENGTYSFDKTEEEVRSSIPEELQTEAVKKFISETFSELKTRNAENVNAIAKNELVEKNKKAGVGTFSKSDDPSCAFHHQLADNTFSAVHLWLKKLMGLNETKAQYAFEIWNDYIQYEHARLTGAVVLKKVKKPDLVVVHISPWASRETLQQTIESKSLKKKLEKLSAAMSIQGQGDFTFFEDYKKVPCGIVAMDFKDVIYIPDIGMVVRGARFYPAKMK